MPDVNPTLTVDLDPGISTVGNSTIGTVLLNLLEDGLLLDALLRPFTAYTDIVALIVGVLT